MVQNHDKETSAQFLWFPALHYIMANYFLFISKAISLVKNISL